MDVCRPHKSRRLDRYQLEPPNINKCMDEQLDLLICIIPKVNPDSPTVGPAILKSHLIDAGFTCEVIDFNIHLYNELKKNNEHQYFFEKDFVFLDRGKVEFESFCTRYEYVFLSWIEAIKNKNPKFVGMSLLSFYSKTMATHLSKLIRIHLPAIKIIWGGAEVSIQSTEPNRQSNLIDHYISGDGEQAIIDLLSGNLEAPGINLNGPSQIKDLNTIKLPNYDDIDWSDYSSSLNNPVYITGSRGCVKKCTFCDVGSLWPKYTFRSGDSITNEIIHLNQKYNRHTFRFTDSLINGSLTAFKQLLLLLKEYRLSTNSNIEWISQWIVRSKLQMPEENFKLLKDSGCLELEIGIESFSQQVRYHMGKKFSDIDMLYCLSMLQKYKIRHSLLMFVGYPTETEEDHQQTLMMIRKLHELGYFDSRNENGWKLLNLQIGNVLYLEERTPLWELTKDKVKNYKNAFEWDYEDNTFPVRVRRLEEINELVKSITGSNHSWLTTKRLEQLKSMLNKNVTD